jgi:hypothetical protein
MQHAYAESAATLDRMVRLHEKQLDRMEARMERSDLARDKANEQELTGSRAALQHDLTTMKEMHLAQLQQLSQKQENTMVSESSYRAQC